MNRPIRVLLADDHPLLRAGVAQSLAESRKFEVVAQAGTADEAVRMAGELRPAIVLLDISMPGHGLTAAERIHAAAPEIAIVVLTVSEADEDVMAALKAGARGYVLKGVGSAALVDILESVARGESYVPPSLAARLLTEMRNGEPRAAATADPLATLTQREDEILRLVAKGLSNKEVALRLDLQEKTVKHHMTRILNKLRVRNRTEAAILLREATARRT